MILKRRQERPKKAQLVIRVLGHLLSYAKHQFGDRVEGRSYRERDDGERMDNWTGEIMILMKVYGDLSCVYGCNEVGSMIDNDNLALPYLKKCSLF